MARATVKDGVLRGCPTCGTKVAEANIGLRDFRWVNEALPGKVGGMDIDFCISQSATERTLFLEMKPRGARISKGARLTFASFVKQGFDCWVVWDVGDGQVQRGVFDSSGCIQRVVDLSQEELAEEVAEWWNAGL